MKKREKIILFLAVMVSAYGLVELLIISPKKNASGTGQPVADANSGAEDFAAGAMAGIMEIEMQRKQTDWRAMMAKIESPWEHDPFVHPPEPEPKPGPEQEMPVASPVRGFTYSGYMNMGTSLFAVINGREYKTGEVIDEYGYEVKKITPRKVVLQKNADRAVIFLEKE